MESSALYTENLIIFLEQLRSEGLLISTSEAGDAALVMSAIGLGNRQQLKFALCSLLAKSNRDIRAFNEVFDEFFVAEHVIFERDAKQIEEQRARAKRIELAREELSDANLPDEVTEVYADVNERRQQWLKDMISRVNDSPRHLPLAEDYIKKIATGWMASGGAEGVAKKRNRDENDLMHKNLAAITEDEAPRALALIETLVKRINGASERKYKRSGRDGMPDLRATIHDSLRTGGVPLHPRYKRRPRTSRRVVILCDVSESMYRFSGFALRFITALGNTASKTSAYIFSEGVEEIGLSNLTAFEDTVKNSSLWRLGTDAGSGIEYIRNLRPSPLGPQTLFIIISDAKTINPSFALQELEDVSRVCRSVLWMNPDNQPSKFSKELEEKCTMLSCGTLSELAKACARTAII